MANLLSQTSSVSSTERIVLYETKLHWISFVVPIFLMIIGSVGVFFLLLAVLSGHMGIMTILSLALSILFYKGFMSFMCKKKTKIMLNESQLSIITNFFSTTAVDLALNKLEGMQLFQSFLEKQLNFGNLVVTTGGITHSYFIQYPMELREQILKLTANRK